MEWVKTILNAVRVAVDGVSAQIERLKIRVKSVEEWVKSLDWVPVVKPVDETLLPETTLDYNEGATFTAPMPTVGLTYTVTIGEKTYEAEAWEYTDSLNAVCIGKAILSADSTDTFIFIWGRGSQAGQRIFYATEGVTDGKVTVSIGRYSENDNRLPDEFIPYSVLNALKSKVTRDPVFSGTFSQNRKADSDIGQYSHAEGYETTASGKGSHAEGSETEAMEQYSHAEGENTEASGVSAHAEGNGTKASGIYSHAEGSGAEASNTGGHAEGESTKASGRYAHAEGSKTVASGSVSHAEGQNSSATGSWAHAEGYFTVASGEDSHAEGTESKATNYGAHAEGGYTKATGKYAHAEGKLTRAAGDYSHVEGRNNIEDTEGKYAHIVGNGPEAQSNYSSNAHTLSWAGVPWFQGRPQFGGTAQDDGSQSVVANGDKEFILASSTEGSTKKFKITVDDSGVLTATEITA